MPHDMRPRPSLPGGDNPCRPATAYADVLRRRLGEKEWRPIRKRRPSPPGRPAAEAAAPPARRRKRSKLREIVAWLGFASVREYYASPAFAVVREKALRKLGAACVRCGADADGVHFSKHTRANVGGKSVRDVHPVCGDCARQARLRPDGKRSGLAEINAFLFHNPLTPPAAGEGPRTRNTRESSA